MFDNLSNIPLLILEKFCKWSFSKATEVQNAGLPMVRNQGKGTKSGFVNMWNSKQVSENLFIKIE